MTKRSFLPSAPNKGLWIAAIIIGVLGILAHFMNIEAISKYNYEMLLIGFILLVIGTMFRNV
jgi:hypothetical protein